MISKRFRFFKYKSWFELIFAGTAFSIETSGAFAIRLNSRKLSLSIR